MKENKGFTLIEILLTIVILSIIIIGVHKFFQNFLDVSLGEKVLADLQGDVKLGLNVIEQDIKMACFGMPPGCRVASHNGGGIVINTTQTDRLFLASGWEILRDFSNNSMEDGVISDADYTKIVTRKGRENLGGYFGRLQSDASTGATSITLTDLDIDSPDALIPDEDFRPPEALILYWANSIEGQRIGTITGNDITFFGNDSLANYYPAATTQVVPAIAYYIGQDANNRYWLFRNGSRLLPDVIDFQVEFGYDRDGNSRITTDPDDEWIDEIPTPFDPNLLLCTRVTIVVNLIHTRRFERGQTSQYTYTITGEFRN